MYQVQIKIYLQCPWAARCGPSYSNFTRLLGVEFFYYHFRYHNHPSSLFKNLGPEINYGRIISNQA